MGEIGGVFNLHRSMRHGCPLAPYLSILAIDILGYINFADDTALYLKGTKDNMDKAKKVLDTFCLTSGAHINWHKSCAIWATKMGRDWN